MRRCTAYKPKGGSALIPVESIIAYFPLNTNGTDAVNGIDEDVSLNTVTNYPSGGIVGNMADFTDSGFTRLRYNEPDVFSFGDGITDVPFSITAWVNFNGVANAWFVSKREPGATLNEYQLIYFNGQLMWFQYDNGANNASLRVAYSFSPVVDTWYHVGLCYTPTEHPRLFLNGVKVGADTTVGTYTAMKASVEPLLFGKFRTTGSTYSLDGFMDEILISNIDVGDAKMLEFYNAGLSGTPLVS